MANVSTDLLDLSAASIAFRTTLYTFLGLLIVSGNILSMAVTRRVPNLADSTKVLMTTLAVYDLLVGLLFILTIFSSALNRWPFGTLVCKMHGIGSFVAVVMSLAAIIGLHVERYIAVTRPYKFPEWCTRRRAIILVLLTSALALTTAVVLDILAEPLKYFSLLATCLYTNSSNITNVVLLVVGDILPISIMACIYYRLIKISQQHKLRNNRHGRNEENNIQDNKALKTFLVVTLTFAVCCTPYFIARTVEGYTGVANPFWLQITSASLFSSNSAWNVFIYCLFNRSYRQTAKKIIKERFSCCQGSVVPVDA